MRACVLFSPAASSTFEKKAFAGWQSSLVAPVASCYSAAFLLFGQSISRITNSGFPFAKRPGRSIREELRYIARDLQRAFRLSYRHKLLVNNPPLPVPLFFFLFFPAMFCVVRLVVRLVIFISHRGSQRE